MESKRLMDIQSSLNNVNNKCIVCNSSLSSKKTFEEFPIQSQLTSTFLKASASNNKSLTHHLFTPAICTHCGLRQIATSSSQKIHSFSDYRIKYNEPTYHLDKISRLIGSADKSYKLKCYSYKDDLLATNIQSQFSHSIYDKIDDKRLPINHTVIHIARRYIEHFTCHESLNKFLVGIDKGDFLYLEILDFSEQQHPLFLWDERHLYPTSKFLISLFERVGFELIFHRTFREGEPFHSLFFQRIKLESLTNLSHFPQEKNSIDIFRLYRQIIDISREITTSADNLNFYGISHKSLTLATFCKAINQNIYIRFYDSSESKVHKFWHNIQIKSFDSLESNDDTHHIFSFGGDNASQLINRLPKNTRVSSLSSLFK